MVLNHFIVGSISRKVTMPANENTRKNRLAFGAEIVTYDDARRAAKRRLPRMIMILSTVLQAVRLRLHAIAPVLMRSICNPAPCEMLPNGA